MEFNKGDRVFHKNLKLFGTFVDYAWETNAEADVDFEMEDGYIEQRHVSINQLQKCPSDEEIDNVNRRLLDRSGDGRQRTTKIDDYRSGKIPL